jgi:hypothetical protein
MTPNETTDTPVSESEGNGPSKWAPVDLYFNRNHDPEDLIRYQGQWVAWSLDGRKVLCASPDGYRLCEMIDAAGLKPGQYVLGGIPPKGFIPEPGLVALD